jgi:endonuclease YncB( thermonuclease family)
MRRFITLFAGMILLVFPETGCSSGTSRPDITISQTRAQSLPPSTTPVLLSLLTPIKSTTNDSQSIVLLTFTPTKTPIPRFTFTPTLNPLTCVPTDVESEYGLVKWIPDGDTIVVDILGRLRTVHYLGIEAPGFIGFTEYRGPTAARFNEKLTRNQLVRLVRDGRDRDSLGQLLRYVFVGDLFLNYELVRQGLAYAVVNNPDISCENTFIRAEEMAKQADLGLWEATRTPHRTSTPSRTLTAITFPATLSPSFPTDQFTHTSTLTPVHTFTLTISPTPTLTPTVTDTVTSTPELTGTTTLTTTGYIHFLDIAYEGESVQDIDEHD